MKKPPLTDSDRAEIRERLRWWRSFPFNGFSPTVAADLGITGEELRRIESILGEPSDDELRRCGRGLYVVGALYRLPAVVLKYNARLKLNTSDVEELDEEEARALGILKKGAA